MPDIRWYIHADAVDRSVYQDFLKRGKELDIMNHGTKVSRMIMEVEAHEVGKQNISRERL